MGKIGAVLVAALLLGAALRFYGIENRPLQSDEGVNYYFIREIRRTGAAPYSASEFHGPLYFHAARFFADTAAAKVCASDAPECFKDSEIGIRLASIISGLLLVLTPLLLSGIINSKAIGSTALLFAASPLLVFYARTGIHESFFLLISITFGFTLLRFLLKPGAVALFVLALTAALLIATKETFVLLLAALGAASLTQTAAAGRFLFRKFHVTASALVLLSLTLFLLFGAGKNSLVLPLQGMLSWSAKGFTDASQTNPWWYFLRLVLHTEPPAILGIAGTLLFIRGQCETHEKFLALWTIFTLALYSAVPYKTPWLAINFIAPALLTGALALNRIPEVRIRFSILAAVILCQVALAAHLSLSGERNFKREIFAADTSDSVRDIAGSIISYCKSRGPDCRVYVGLKHYWPIPFYLQEIYSQVAYDPGRSFEQVQGAVDVAVMNPPVARRPGWTVMLAPLSQFQSAAVFLKEPAPQDPNR